MQNQEHSRFAGVEILPGSSMQEFLDEIRSRHVPLYQCLDIARLDPAELARIYQSLDCFATPFELAKLAPADAAYDKDFWAVVEEVVRRYATFTPNECVRYGAQVGELSVRPSGGQFRAELPRVELVGSGTR